MRVLHVAPSVARAYGGPTQSLVGYTLAARDAGAEVAIAAPRPAEADAAWLAAALPGVPLHLFPAAGSGAFVISPALLRFVGRAGAGFDAVHVHGLLNPVSSAAARLCIRNGWATVIRPFGTLSRYTFSHRRGGLKRAWFHLLDGPNVARAGGVHFTTVTECQEAAWHGLTMRGHVIPPPWIRGPLHAPHVQGGGNRVLFLSRLHPVKNLERLLAAWALVVRHLPDAQLRVAGSGPARYVEGLHALTTRLGIAASVHFEGFVSGVEKDRLLAEADLFVLPSHHENFGVAVLEALAAGLPVVISPEVQLAGFVREHGLGEVAGSDGPEALAASLVRAMGDARLRTRCRLHGPEIVAHAFSPAEIGRRLLDMYGAALTPR